MNVLDRENIDTLINKFENYTTSHPNISKLWIETLELLKNKNKILISQSLHTLSLLDNKEVNDIDINRIILLTIYKKSLE
jgi:hypothetical protein